jgi:hypothetical protein
MIGGNRGRGGAATLSHSHDQYDIFVVGELFGLAADKLEDNEREFLAELAKIAVLLPEGHDGQDRRRRGRFGTPAWYEHKCEALSRAVWVGQLTEREATAELEFQHTLMLREMERDRLWRRPQPTTGRRRRPRRVAFRYRGYRCRSCGEQVGPFTGMCASCHFAGWWP